MPPKNSIDILNLEWPSSDRDLHIVTPVLVYLQKKYNLSFRTKSIFCGYFYLLKYKPKLLVISNFSGSALNHRIVKMAHIMGIRTISFISEGNVKPEAIEQFLWGWNKDKILYVDKMFLWTNRSRQLFLQQYPNLANKLVVTGATGFDRYKLLKFKSKASFLSENQLHYKKIVGIAAWGFDHLFGDYYDKHQEYFIRTYGLKQIHMHRHDLFALQKIYKRLIQNNPDILFILRYHPGTLDVSKNEFYGLDQYKNVFISSRDRNTEYTISDLINVSDIWIGYETTTALEAWLLDKTTILINPSGSDFIRENVYQGSVIVNNYEALQSLIDRFFNIGELPAFLSRASLRQSIIHDVIEYDDGKNHVRAADEIIAFLQNDRERKKYYPLSFYKALIKEFMKNVLRTTFLKRRWQRESCRDDLIKKYQAIYAEVIS